MPTEPLPVVSSLPDEADPETRTAGDDGPPSVSRDRTVVRFVKTPHHLNGRGTRLRPAAFRPPAGSDEISVVQQDFDGDDYCKKMAVAKVPVSQYHGLASGLVGAIMDSGARAVLDTPHIFPGHADIITPYPSPKDEPPPAEETKALQEFCEALVEHFHYFADPNKAAEGWEGPPLARAS
ncbi:hypothetical protein [Microbacterium sp. B35-30]|uniref:hypothetical protein n=1 Tax=Microbacterium sp. B35-30 TaxID=1962642 RepID=UPI0013D015B7|nr:hypothetical protein [Microbacterium sp. B35-30]